MINVANRPVEEAPPQHAGRSILGALRFSDFRLLWAGLFLANTGAWMQITALAYLVAQLTKSPVTAVQWVAYAGLAQIIPALIVSPVGGVLAEMFPRRAVAVYANIGGAACAALVAYLSFEKFLGVFPLLPILALVAAGSILRVLDLPARQSWIPQIVERDDVASAVGLHSLASGAPGILGPMIAGALLFRMPVANILEAGAALTFPIVFALVAMKPAPRTVRRPEPIVRALHDGLGYLAGDHVLRLLLAGAVLCGALARSYVLLLPALALRVITTNAGELGLLYGLIGAGAILGALTTAYLGNVPYRLRLWYVSGLALGICVVMLANARDIVDAAPWAPAAGFMTMMFVGSTNILIHNNTAEFYRGRVITLCSILQLAFIPVGALAIGFVAQMTGVRNAFTIFSASFIPLLTVIALFVPRKKHENS